MIEKIIGKGKAFEPPFQVVHELCPIVADRHGKMLCCAPYDARTANHIVELLNERWKDETMQS